MEAKGTSKHEMNEEATSATNRPEMYDAISHYIGEIYDRTETQREDVGLIRSLMGERTFRILEPFCGHGRILIPLAEDGHEIVGLDLSEQMLKSARLRLEALSEEIQGRVSLALADVVQGNWPSGFDLVILGANCLYELATAGEQENCIKAAAAALRAGGYLYLDNNHMEGALDPRWCDPGIHENVFPSGVCSDGTQVRGTSQVVRYDISQRLVRNRRVVRITTPDGTTRTTEYVKQVHPPSTVEMRTWLSQCGFVIENLWGDRRKSPYTERSGRAIFWARLSEKK